MMWNVALKPILGCVGSAKQHQQFWWSPICVTPPLIVLLCFCNFQLSQLQCDVWPDQIMLQACECAATDGGSQGGETKEEEENKQALQHNYALKTTRFLERQHTAVGPLKMCLSIIRVLRFNCLKKHTQHSAMLEFDPSWKCKNISDKMTLKLTSCRRLLALSWASS